MAATLNPAEWQRKMNTIRKLLWRKIEMGEAEVERRCTAAYELFVAGANLKVKRALPQTLKDKDWPQFLAVLQEGMDCDPFMEKEGIHALVLEAWSSRYDLARLVVELQRHEINILKNKAGVMSHTIQEAEVELAALEKEAAGYNTKFAYCRAVNLIDRGLYKPPITVAEQRKMRGRSFLAVSSGDKAALRCLKQDEGSAALKKCLGEEKQDPNQVDLATGAQPLHYASMRGRAAEVGMLLAAKANVNAQTLRGFTPLHFAYQYEHNACVDLLLQHGARVDVKSALGKTPGQMKVSLTAVIAAPPVKPFY